MLAIVLFKTSDVILFLGQGRYWLGSALLLAFAAFYLWPNVYTTWRTPKENCSASLW